MIFPGNNHDPEISHSNAKHGTEIPIIIDPVALGYVLEVLGSIIVGISVMKDCHGLFTQ